MESKTSATEIASGIGDVTWIVSGGIAAKFVTLCMFSIINLNTWMCFSVNS